MRTTVVFASRSFRLALHSTTTTADNKRKKTIPKE